MVLILSSLATASVMVILSEGELSCLCLAAHYSALNRSEQWGNRVRYEDIPRLMQHQLLCSIVAINPRNSCGSTATCLGSH
ncbi:hypothetical protein MIMGU_mgv1a017350mg [Erythranthe guttata]|uniref:Secreted protein n=1 Tax=Erythranthe guttata TaxID=4155 RepID=A0A022Q8P2_ERYGU|nr:hypothetical protein MIMGU_mgv1a017350mg [Erythranthe guttata]